MSDAPRSPHSPSSSQAPLTPRLACIVSHTHWDREWYLPFHAFRVLLARTVSGVLDALEADGAYRHFCLDGQSIVLEDHLAVRPEDEPRMRRLAARGALALGPWYVLPDEFLIPPEASLRNLVLGRKVARRLGPVQAVGYAPDAFGHVAQMPQILRLAGIDSFLYTRGDADEIDELGLEWIWEAPDGTGVLAVHQCGGYCNAAALGYEELWHAHTQRDVDPGRAVEQVRDLFVRMAAESNGDVWLLNNGCDHFPAQRDFAAVLGALREAFPAVEFRHVGFSEYVEAVRGAGFATKRWRGELRGGKRHHVLSGVWSARMPLKQLNDEAHTLLADVCEPLTALGFFQYGLPYPGGLLEDAWKLLLQNQPHDSICGCSTDEVHREMGPRFDGVIQTADAVIRETLQALVPSFGTRPATDRDTVLGVFHPLPEARRAVVDRLVVLQPFEGLDPSSLRVEDAAGRRLPFEVTARHRVRRFWGIDWRTVLDVETQQERFDATASAFGDAFLEPPPGTELVDTFLRLRFLADLPATGFARFRLVEDAGSPVPALPEADRVRVEDGVLSNGLVAVRLHADGTFDLEDLRTGRRFEGLNALQDAEDVGDEYDFSPAAETLVVEARGEAGRLVTVDAGGLKGAREAHFVLPLPRRIAHDRKRRVAETVDCPVSVRLTLETGSPVVSIDVSFENHAEDHRLVARFPTGLRTDTVVSDAHFLLARRPVDPPDDTDWCQPAPDTVPQQEFSLVANGTCGLAVLVKGLPEVAALRAGLDGRAVDLRLTLLRCVGWLSRDDLPTRRFQNAGPTLATPDAQCPGRHRFRYAVLAFEGDEIQADVKGWSRRWRTPRPSVQGVLDGAAAGGDGLVAVRTRRTTVTAVKRHDERDTLVVRLTNLVGESVAETLTFGLDLAAARRVDLHEVHVEPLKLEDARTLRVTFRPHEILTVEVEPA